MNASLLSSGLESKPGVGEAISQLYTSEQLSMPIVPQAFEGDLREVAPLTFGTRKIDGTLYELNRFVQEIEKGTLAPYMLFGFAGHGFVSQAAHYYLVSDQVAVFIQSRWASALSDPKTERVEYESQLSLLKALLQDVDEAVAEGKFPLGRHLVVIQSDFQQSRWGWHATNIEWNLGGELSLLGAMVAVRRLSHQII